MECGLRLASRMKATDGLETDWTSMILVGVIARTHGRRGEVIVNLETDFRELRFLVNALLYAKVDGVIRPLKVEAVRFSGARPVLAFAGVNTIDEAEPLAGYELRIPVSDQQPLPGGLFYEHDLIGCKVLTVEKVTVGVVTGIQGEPGSNRLLVTLPGTQEQVDIPLVDSICVRVEPSQGVVVIDPPVGLLELNRSNH